ncbi:hypothetical protein ACWZHB_11235 [Nocardia sp. FBN12]|uniref:hypothetical protein n=1 Tax=Nocardia sp. FBN12 TaxID=3419766 RepID=UPI003D093DB8
MFRTSGFPETPLRRYVTHLTRDIEAKGFDVVDAFDCRGFDTWLPLRIVGGIQKGHPDATDITAARAFAGKLQARMTAKP